MRKRKFSILNIVFKSNIIIYWIDGIVNIKFH